MTRHLAERLGQALLVLLAAFTVAFVLLQALPGDAVLIKFLGSEMGLTADQIAELRIAYGADAPLWEQYLHTLGNFLRGDFGTSIRAGVPVSSLLAEAIPSTLLLAALAFVAAALLATLLAVPISAPLAQVLIRNMDQVFGEPFVAVARAKGATHAWVLWKHVARNALPPTLTMAGVLFGELLGGAVVTETVFGLSGLGGLTQQAVANQDVAVLQAIVVLSAAAFVTISLTVDLLLPWLDPRLGLRATGAA